MKNFSNEWEFNYSSDTTRHKNKYPFMEVIQFVMRNFGSAPDRSQIKILDLGCGWGNHLKFLQGEGFDAYGIDFSKTAVEYCQTFCDQVVVGDAAKLPYESDYFDAVFDRMAIQHNSKDSAQNIVKEVHRVLKPGGCFQSTLVESCEYDFSTEFYTHDDVLKLGGIFKENVEINYVEGSTNHGKDIYRCHFLNAQKA